MKKKSLIGSLMSAFEQWFTRLLAEDETVKSVFETYAELRVHDLTGHTAEEWRACRVRAVEIK